MTMSSTAVISTESLNWGVEFVTPIYHTKDNNQMGRCQGYNLEEARRCT